MDNKSKLIVILMVVVLGVNMWAVAHSAQESYILMIGGGASLAALLLAIFGISQSAGTARNVVSYCRERLVDVGNAVRDRKPVVVLSGPNDSPELDVVSAQFESLAGSLAEQYRHNSEQLAQLKNAGVIANDALLKANTLVMIADKNYNITFVNQALTEMLTTHQNTLSAHFPGFNVANLVGTNIDVFHKNPAHQRQLLSNIQSSFESEIQVGELVFGLQITPLKDNQGQRVSTLVQWSDYSDRLEAEKLKIENLRINTALGAVSTNVMLADADYNIVYMNDTLINMLQANQDKFVATFNNFNVSSLIGTNIDVFHKAPSHQRQILDQLTSEYRSEVSVQDLTFSLVINPIFNDDGSRLGTSVEWADLTLLKQQQLQERVNARMKVALDNVSTNVMLADNEFNIIYLNDSLKTMMQEHVATFRTLKADFNPDNLVGQNIDIFHKNPAHQRELLGRLADTYNAQISLGPLSFSLTANPVIDAKGNRLGTTLEWEDITEQKHQELLAQANARIKVALDNVTTNVMVADHDYNIVYLNHSVQEMLRKASSDLRKDLPNFNPDKLIGQNIDVFHKNPQHQRSMLDRLVDSYDTVIKVGGRHFNLIATPVMSDQREKLGVVVEWADITAQTVIEGEVEKLVSDVSSGNLGALIATKDKDGFFLKISEGLNELSQTVNAFVRDISVSLQKLSEGDLKVKIDNEYQGMFGDIKESLNATVGKLNSVMTNIQSSSSSISTANGEISQGNNELSARTERQASSLEETAASLEQLTSNIRHTADNAKTANKAASSTKTEAHNGEQIVKQAMESMGAITDSSNRIEEIISVIDEIAFQTNLLALNASVEAARAGDQGRGFAVVANEVRNLAQRSAVSAKEIKELIDVSSERVSSGSSLVTRCGQSLSDILNHADELSALIADIANATNEQATGVGEINQAVAQLDDITQQNAALSEEVTSASHASLEQVQLMSDQVSFFSVDGSKADAGRSHKPSRRASASTNVAQKSTVTASRNLSGRSSGAPARPAPKPISKAPKPPLKTTSSATISAKSDDGDEWEEF